MYNSEKPVRTFSLNDSDVIKADSLRARINFYLGMIQSQQFYPTGPVLSKKTPEEILKYAGRIRNISKKTRSRKMPAFDRLVLEDCVKNAEIAESYCDYNFNPESKLRIGSFLGKIFGPGSYYSLLQEISPENYPHDKIHQLFLQTQSRGLRQIPVEDILSENSRNSDFRKTRKLLLERLNFYKDLATSFYQDLKVDCDLSKFSFEFCPSGYTFSYWDDVNLMVHLDPNKAIFYKKKFDQEVELEDLDLRTTSVHEVGHGIHQIISDRVMPKGLAPNIENYIPFVHGAHGEGLALLTEAIWRDYAKENSLLTPEEINLLDLYNDTYMASKVPGLVHDLCEQKEKEEMMNKKFPEHLKRYAHKRLATLSGIKKYQDFFCFEDRIIEETLQQATYLFGEKRISNLAEKLAKQGLKPGEIIECLSHGAWCNPKAHENFVFDVLLQER